MKVIIEIIVGLLTLSCASGQAPYPPSGYRPQGRQFNLPHKPNTNQGFGSNLQPQNQFGAPPNQYGAPPNQYGAPDNRPQVPPNQYIPTPESELQPTDVRFNFGSQQSFGQQDSSNQQGFSATRPQNLYGSGQQSVSIQQQQLTRSQKNYVGQEQRNFNTQDQNQDFGETNTNNNQQSWANANGYQNFAPNPAESFQSNSGGRKYLAPQRPAKQNAALYQTPAEQSADQEFTENSQNSEQSFGVNSNLVPAKSNQDVANQNYLPPTTTERRRYPEPTTRKPDREPVEPEDNESEDPNVAIATAVARGQYYLLQPDGRLHRVVYKTEEDPKNNVFSAKLLYQFVEPITAPIYTYNSPLVRIS